MARALWKGEVIAESDDIVIVEGNLYFPIASVRRSLLRPSGTTTVCPWKGTASYYDIVIDDLINRDAAWYYESPRQAAKQIEGRVAFWRGVVIEETVSV
ncbi:MAG: hypothetical protein ACI9MC_001763 [Kiritimatiellia bacterium]|jgi:uncharacterized protein (DUF427 family)